MSLGNVGGKSTKIEMITWMRGVKEVSRREGSSGSGADSGSGSRLSSRSRDGSAGDKVDELAGKRKRSDSRHRGGDEQKERDNQSLQAELVGLWFDVLNIKLIFE
jgi:WD repeat-containing protein 59